MFLGVGPVTLDDCWAFVFVARETFFVGAETVALETIVAFFWADETLDF